MVGGPADIVDRCRPVLSTFGDPVLHIGPLGAGQDAKLLNNSVFTAQLALAQEVFALAAAHGLDQEVIGTVLSAGSGRSYAADVLAGSGFDLERFGRLPGELLAKDVGILTDRMRLNGTALLEAADAALHRMGVARPVPRY